MAVASALLFPAAALADCTVNAVTGVVDCGTTATDSALPTVVDGVPPVPDSNHYIFDTGVPMTATIDSGAVVTDAGLWFEQDAAGVELDLVNNGSVTNSTPGNGLEGFGNGGLLTYSGNGSAIATDTSGAWGGLALFNQNGGGIRVGSADAPVTGTFTGTAGLYAGPRGGFPDVVGDVAIYLAGGQVTGLTADDPSISSYGVFVDTVGGVGNSFIQTTGHTIIQTNDQGFAIIGFTGSGNSTIVSDALIGTSTSVVGEGLRAHVTEGAGNATAIENGGWNFANFYGIRAGVDGTGAVDVEVSNGTRIVTTGAVTDTIFASGIRTDASTGDTTVMLSGAGTSVTATQGYGLYMDSTSGAINAAIGAGVNVSGAAAGIDIVTPTGAALIDNAGTVNSASALGSIAVLQTGGSLTLNNAGSLYGTLNLKDTTGSNTITNGGLWSSSGSSSFGTGATTLTNVAGGTISVSGCSAGCAFDFFGSAPGTLANAGTINVGTAGNDVVAFNFNDNAADTVTNASRISVNGAAFFTGLAVFDNTGGVLDMRHGGTGNSNTDTVGISGAFGGGTLGVDVFLGGAGSTADTLAIGGAATGQTTIAVADTNPGGGAMTGASGIPIVVVAGASNAGSFVLDPSSTVIGGGYENINGTGVLQKGAFDYYLTTIQPGTFGLVSAPDPTAVQAPIVVTGAQSIWYETALGWQDRAASPTEAKDAGFWTSIVGSRTSRSDDHAMSVAGSSTDFDLDYNQDVWGLLLGYQAAVGESSDAHAVKLGLMGGYAGADLSFDHSAMTGVAPADFRYSGGLLGATATYRSGTFFADVLAKVDLLRVRLNDIPDGSGGFTTDRVDSTTWGAIGTIGWHNDVGKFFIDPFFTLAGTRSHIGDVALPGTQSKLAFRGESTFRGALGARFGGVLSNGANGTVDGSLTARLWDQFTGDRPTVSVVDTGTSFDMQDRFDGTFGEVSARLDWNSTSGMSGWLEAGAKFNNQFTTSALRAGLRWTW